MKVPRARIGDVTVCPETSGVHSTMVYLPRHSRGSGNPGPRHHRRVAWTPASAGVTLSYWKDLDSFRTDTELDFPHFRKSAQFINRLDDTAGLINSLISLTFVEKCGKPSLAACRSGGGWSNRSGSVDKWLPVDTGFAEISVIGQQRLTPTGG